jgi:hypothetical protein
MNPGVHNSKNNIFFGPMPPHVLVDFVVLPPGHGRSEVGTPMRCSYVVPMMLIVIGGCSARRALKLKFY